MYEILKDMKGSQDGRFTTQFYCGDQVELSDSLAEVALADEWAKEIKDSEIVDIPKEGTKDWVKHQLNEMGVKFNDSSNKKDLELLLEKALES